MSDADTRPKRPRYFRERFQEGFALINEARRSRGQEPLGDELFPRSEERLLRLARNNKVKVSLPG